MTGHFFHSSDPFDVHGKADPNLADSPNEVVREVAVPNKQGLHARPVMRFVDLASTFRASVRVTNISRKAETVDGKSAMHMMLLEGTQGCILRIETRGADAQEAADALEALVRDGFGIESHQGSA